MQTLRHQDGLGDFWSDLVSGAVGEVTPEIQSQAKAIILPIITPYLTAMVLLSLGGFVFGLSAYLSVREKKKAATP